MPEPLSQQSRTWTTEELQARIDELEDERERLRRRTHEIQEAADKKMGKLESRVAQYRNRFSAARDRVAPWVATWTTDPPSQERFGWWRYASQDQVDEITALVSEVNDAQAERDCYRQALQHIASMASPLDTLAPVSSFMAAQRLAKEALHNDA